MNVRYGYYVVSCDLWCTNPDPVDAADEGLNVDRSRAEVSSSVLQPSISR